MISQILAAAVTAASLTVNGPSGWVCEMLDRTPTESGVTSVVLEIFSRGYDAEDGAKYVVATIQSQCPEYIPLLLSWAENYG